MRGREGAAHEVLVPNGDVENCTAAGYMEPKKTIISPQAKQCWFAELSLCEKFTYHLCRFDM